ncbi:hypothetical protein [Bifidobacterium breve]|uniref:hypothetical protein n=1 Tax=Bifidobacterium breve TaxID=1685 RepID=UPI003A4E3FFC
MKKLDAVFRYPLRLSGFQSCAAIQDTSASPSTSSGEPPTPAAICVILYRLVRSVWSLYPAALSESSHLSISSRHCGGATFLFDMAHHRALTPLV